MIVSLYQREVGPSLEEYTMEGLSWGTLVLGTRSGWASNAQYQDLLLLDLPWWLMYTMVVELSVPTNTCLPRRGPRQDVLQETNASDNIRGIPGCGGGIREKAWLDTCTRGTPALRNAGSDYRLKAWRQAGGIFSWCFPHSYAHLGTRPSSVQAASLWLQMPYFTESSEIISVGLLW